MNRIHFNKQKGFSLTEAMVAFGVTAIGLLAVASFQAGLFQQSAYNKARSEATALAQQKIEEFKHYTSSTEDSYIDDNDDGVMDADGDYAENPINGQNAVFTRSWTISTTNTSKQIAVTVSWVDTDNQNQSVLLNTDIPWLSPRTGADQLSDVDGPILDAPTGRAKLGEGNLNDLTGPSPTKIPNLSPDGLDIYKHEEDLLLADVNGDILLTLLDACSTETGLCTDFVRISGTVYLDTINSTIPLEDLLVLPSDAAHCRRWVPEGSLTRPPTTQSGDYEYYKYTCYFGGGWHGNIGFVKTRGLQLKDKVCQGDPTAFEAWKSPVIALRRAYRGMLHYDVNGVRLYETHGIKDAVQLSGQDFVFTELDADITDGSHCSAFNAPMTRPDSDSGRLFVDVPTDFVCLNQDVDGDGNPDLLDIYDTSKYGANTTCPYDPTSPPVDSHVVSGLVSVAFSTVDDLANFAVETSDGPGNCEWTDFATLEGNLVAKYVCQVFDWGVGWTGSVNIMPNSDQVHCPVSISSFTDLISDTTQNFSCVGTGKIVVEGPIQYLTEAPISSILIMDGLSEKFGQCEFNASQYRCVIPTAETYWYGSLTVTAAADICGSVEGVFNLSGLTPETNPHYLPITVINNSNQCPTPIEPIPTEPLPTEPLPTEPLPTL